MQVGTTRIVLITIFVVCNASEISGNQIRALAPRTEPLETPIEDPKKERVVSHWNPNHSWTQTTITKVEN